VGRKGVVGWRGKGNQRESGLEAERGVPFLAGMCRYARLEKAIATKVEKGADRHGSYSAN
jgi:hypothetical protein